MEGAGCTFLVLLPSILSGAPQAGRKAGQRGGEALAAATSTGWGWGPWEGMVGAGGEADAAEATCSLAHRSWLSGSPPGMDSLPSSLQGRRLCWKMTMSDTTEAFQPPVCRGIGHGTFEPEETLRIF